MNRTTILGTLLLCSILIGSLMLIQQFKSKKPHTKTIAIIQTASHPALDAVAQGFMQSLKSTLPTCNVELYNGQGSIDQLHMIAKSASHNSAIDAILAIATPAAQVVAHVEHTKPIIIAAVTDPKAAGIMQTNVCGCIDIIDCSKQLKLIKALVPQIKTIGIMFNLGEVNAIVLADQMKALCNKEHIHCIDLAIAQEADILPLLGQRLQECDLLWAPLDNSVAAAASLIAHKALQVQKPFFVSDNLLVSKGALAAAGIDYAQSGEQAASIASALLLEGKQPAELPFCKPLIKNCFVNRTVMQQLGLCIPENFADAVAWVHEESQ